MYHDRQDSQSMMTGHILGLKFQSGWWFTKALETEYIELKPWILLNENDQRSAIAAQTAGSKDDEVKDTLERRFLYPDDSEQNLIFQVQYGIAPSRIQAYPIFGRDRAPNLEGTAEPGTPQVPVTGFDSPYNDPSSTAELFVINEQEFPSIQAYNPTDEPLEARLSFHVTKMKYGTITDMDVMKAVLQGQQRGKLHAMGLGAQKGDQLKVPTWLSRTFGQHIHTTEEILSDSNGQSGDRTLELTSGSS